MTQRTEAPLIFVVQPEMLPGKFSIQPIDPTVSQLLKQDPEGHILVACCWATMVVSAKYEAYRDEGWIEEESIETIARFAVDELKKMLGLPRDPFVIPIDEFWKRVSRGEFEIVSIPTPEEKRMMGMAFHTALNKVLKDYYCAISEERQEDLLLRLRPADVSFLKKYWNYSAVFDEESGGLDWRCINKPFIFTYPKSHKALRPSKVDAIAKPLKEQSYEKETDTTSM